MTPDALARFLALDDERKTHSSVPNVSWFADWSVAAWAAMPLLRARLADRADAMVEAGAVKGETLLDQVKRLKQWVEEREAKLAAAEKALRKVLHDVEWGPEPTLSTSSCPWCLWVKAGGHEPSCELAALLRNERRENG